MKIHRGKSNNKFNGGTSLQASNGFAVVFPLLFLEDSFEKLVLPEYSFLIIPLILLFVMVIVFKRKKKPAVQNARLTDHDRINDYMADARSDPNKYEITGKLCQQFITNHARMGVPDVPHDQFPVETPNCHMDNTQINKFASILSSFPWTCPAHGLYQVQGGRVCYINNNQPVIADYRIIAWIATYEGSDGKLPKLDLFQVELHKLEEEARRNGKWDYSRGVPPK